MNPKNWKDIAIQDIHGNPQSIQVFCKTSFVKVVLNYSPHSESLTKPHPKFRKMEPDPLSLENLPPIPYLFIRIMSVPCLREKEKKV